MTANLPIEMNDQDIEMFIKSFDDFMQHAETDAELMRREAKRSGNTINHQWKRKQQRWK